MPDNSGRAEEKGWAMSTQQPAPSVSRIALTALAYALAVLLGELTFGNPGFPITIWYFETLPAWQWSLPVHLAGFIWLVSINRFFLNYPKFLPIMAATLFFFIGEALNWYFWDFFTYAGDLVWHKALSFWTVILMYAGLCTGAVLLLRIPEKENP
jgi:hypothetical protein